jgi:DNA polymerase
MDRHGKTQQKYTENESIMMYGQDTLIYGGKLCENIVQAIARDVLVDAILRLEKLGLAVLLHIHDEVVVEVPSNEVNQAAQSFASALEHTPDWCEGLPIDCEIRVSKSYGHDTADRA